MRAKSIRARMTQGFALLTALLMLVVSISYLAYTRYSEESKIEQLLAAAAVEIRREVGAGQHDLDQSQKMVDEEIEDLRPANIVLLVFDSHGRRVAQSQSNVPPWPRTDDNWRVTAVPIQHHTVVIGMSWESVERELRERSLLLIGLSSLIVMGSAVGAWFLVGRTLSPIDRLTRQVEVASPDNLRVQLQSPSKDAEIERLVAILNDLLARLGETAAMRGRFYAAASHELRTPLQALTGHLEVALNRERSAADYASALQEGHVQAERLTTLVQDLLVLNRLEVDATCPPGVTLDLADICVNELAPLRALAAKRNLQVELTLPQHCEIVAPWTYANMLIRNLLENAIKYATAGGLVEIEVHDAKLEIRNSSYPLAGWEDGHYFEPFFRPDESRNSETGGNGLGLAICKAICDANGWSIMLHQKVEMVAVTVCFESPRSSTAVSKLRGNYLRG